MTHTCIHTYLHDQTRVTTIIHNLHVDVNLPPNYHKHVLCFRSLAKGLDVNRRLLSGPPVVGLGSGKLG